MELKAGMIVDGTVKSITNFGAFIALEGGATGLCHISEVARSYVSDVHDFLTEGQAVKVCVVSTENGKINLSIKRAQMQQEDRPRPAPKQAAAPSETSSFDSMLKRFLADSDSKIAGSKQYEHRTKTRKR
ncbi:MAG: S1 RNA-binding domain-containing protein [Oscillospiraceae bacterium]|nr:S1 RNA-binding domain-containing protein [Oscillospiraceae bacterium]